MISFLSEGITTFFVKKKIVDENEKSIYKYGFELIISAIISFIIMILIGICTNKIIDSLIFYFCFIIVRTYTGGFHAKTHLKCKVTFAICQILALLMGEVLLRESIIYSIISMVICVILIFRYAPIEHSNKKITNYKKTKIIEIIIVLALYIIGFLFCTVYAKTFVMITSTMIMITGLIVLEIMPKRCCFTSKE